MLHDFKEGQTVYLMSGKRLYIGIISDEWCAPDYKFVNVPTGIRTYLPVNWLNYDRGKGAPCYLSLHSTKEEAIDKWYKEEVEKLEKAHKRLLNTKIK